MDDEYSKGFDKLILTSLAPDPTQRKISENHP